jgi:hypothetical protein
MDKNYLQRVHLRRSIMEEHTGATLLADPRAKPAVDELYTWLVRTYLPTRFPSMFNLSSESLQNLVTKESISLEPPMEPIAALRTLGSHLDEDFLILLPSLDGDGYVLNASVACFPAGFDTREKFGKKLREIHVPVPGYKEKLERSMDKFFDKLEVGKVVRRANVSLYSPSAEPPPLDKNS